MIGISIFSGMENTLDDNILYLREASKLGINKVFTSLHIPEANENFERECLFILEEANKLGMNIIADISKEYFERLNLEKYNIHSLRLDFGFSNKEIGELTNEGRYNITLNASTLSKRAIKEISNYGGDLSKINACHNYYPKKGTGISEELLKDRNNIFKEYGINVIAFIPSRNKQRGPLYEGLPTLEKHRKIDPFISAQHLFKLNVDTVFIGDTQGSREELLRLSKIDKEEIIIPVKIYKNILSEEKYLLEQSYTNRMDPGEFCVRTEESRKYKIGKIKVNNVIDRHEYCVTIDNEKYLRYEGDLQILKSNYEKDHRVNVVADAREASVLIDRIKPGDKFKFELVGD